MPVWSRGGPRFFGRVCLALAALGGVSAAAAGFFSIGAAHAESSGQGPGGAPSNAPAESSVGRLKTIEREEIFAFTRKPEVKKTADGKYQTTFAVKGRCDVAVAVEDADGKMVKHLVYGVLGSNAPEPFQKDALDQSVIWDGKDDMGRAVAQPARCRVRVSLGLDPTFDRVYNHHPKDGSKEGSIQGLAADEHGVYVLQRNVIITTLRMFDHEARYVRTLIPFPGEKLGKPEMNVPTVEVAGRAVPARLSQPPGFLFRVLGCTNRLAAASGWVVTLGDDGHLLRLRQDGTTGGTPYVGPMLPVGRHKPAWGWAAHLALSPDGKWVYVTGLRPGVPPVRGYRDMLKLEGDIWQDRVVLRVPRDADKPIEELQPFIGTTGAGEKGAVSWFQGLACDAKGQIYVCDYAQDLIRVYDEKGAPVKTIPAENPRVVDVHRKTGEIYVLCEVGKKREKPKDQQGPSYWGRGAAKVVLRKLGALNNPKPLMEQPFDFTSVWAPSAPLLCVDSWSEPARVWLLHSGQSVRVYVEKNGRFELDDDFEKDVRDAGLEPYRLSGCAEMDDHFAVDPVRGHLYLRGGGSFRCDDLAGPGRFSTLDIPWVLSALDFSADGLLHMMNSQWRADPAKAQVKEDRGGRHVVFPPESLVPFVPVEKTPTPGARYSMASVAPNGVITGFRVGSPSLMRWDREGRVLAEDVLPGYRGPLSSAIRTDSAGSLYVGFDAPTRHYPPTESPEKLIPPPGMVAKFAAGSKVPANEAAAKPGQTERLWSCPNYISATLGCGCNNATFHVDAYGRSFVPQAIPSTVAILDTNGNRICAVGKYGNLDDPPNPATSKEPIKGSDIRVAWCMRVGSFPDKWLYIVDDGNMRIVRVKLGYRAEERVALP